MCSRWYDIAINNPTFWSDVEINGVLGRTPSALEKTIRLLSARLERSHDAPLSVSLTCEEDGLPLHPRIFHLLAQHSHQWEWACWLLCGRTRYVGLEWEVTASEGTLDESHASNSRFLWYCSTLGHSLCQCAAATHGILRRNPSAQTVPGVRFG
jgi:hypothetical protein